MIRKSILILALGLFVSVTTANASDGGKVTKAVKSKKANATCTKSSCMKDGHCTMSEASKAHSATGKHASAKAKTAATEQKS